MRRRVAGRPLCGGRIPARRLHAGPVRRLHAVDVVPAVAHGGVGGAVLTEDYAMRIGADFYARDAMATVRAAESVFGGD